MSDRSTTAQPLAYTQGATAEMLLLVRKQTIGEPLPLGLASAGAAVPGCQLHLLELTTMRSTAMPLAMNPVTLKTSNQCQ